MFHEMRALLSFTGNGAKFLFLLFLRCPFDAAMTVINAIFLQHAFNAVAHNDSAQLISVCLIFGFASLCLFSYNGIIWSIYAPFVTRMERKLRARLFEKITMFSCERMEATPQGEWVTRLNTDVQMPFSRPIHLPHAVCAVVNIGVSSVFLWLISPEVFGWVILFVIPHIIVSQLVIARAMPDLNRKSLEATAKNTSELTALITCADTATLYDAKDYLMKRFEASSLNLRRANMKMRKKNIIGSALLPLFGMSGYLILLIVSSKWIINGSITFGDLTAAFQYRGGLLLGSMMIISSMISIGASFAGIKRINETMSEKTEESNG
jgi:ABC-type bacteriocin/lantibiotic exporter with double-glycine peptidase domain